jgi:protocatechuate 3,4-dioxygenase beta subunit
MAASVVISGRVTDQNSAALQGVSVTATSPGGTAVEFGPALTGSDGRYELNLDAGVYDLHFAPPSGSDFGPFQYNSLSISENEELDAQLIPAVAPPPVMHVLSGVVTDASGQPVAGATVDITATDGSGNSGSSATDSSGQFSISVPAGKYCVSKLVSGEYEASGCEGNLDLTAGDATQNLESFSLANVNLAVQDSAGNPVPFTWDTYSGSFPAAVIPGDATGTLTGSVVPVAGQQDGLSFNIGAPGQVPVGSQVQFCAGSGDIFTDNPPVQTYGCATGTVTSGGNGNGTTTITITASDVAPPPVMHVLSGVVTDASGQPVAGATVDITATDGSGNSGSSATDSSGQFSISVPAGKYCVSKLVSGEYEASGCEGNLDLTAGDATQNLESFSLANVNLAVQDSAGNPVPFTWDTYSGSFPAAVIPGDATGTLTGSVVPVAGQQDGLSFNIGAPGQVPVGSQVQFCAGSGDIFTDNPPVQTYGCATGTVTKNTTVVLVTQKASPPPSDTTPPVVTGSPDRSPNANGWYKAPVTIAWTAVDPSPSSGTPTIPSPMTFSTEGSNQTVTSSKSCDPAGNCATGTVTGLSLDMTPPTVSVVGVTNGSVYTGGQAPASACVTSDALSGVAVNATVSVTNSGNSFTATCSGATDNAGNAAAPVNVTYQVIPAGWTTAALTDSSGNPIEGASVDFRSATGSVTNATTDSDGIAAAALTPGGYSVTVHYATGTQTKTITVTANGPNEISFTTVSVTAQVNDPDGRDLATASIAHAGNTGTYGPKTAVDGSGDVTFQVLPGTNTFTAYDANGYQTQTLTITGPTTVTFATIPVTVTVLKNGNPLTTASVSHAGNTGAFGTKNAVDNNGQVTFHVLPGTNTFTAWDSNFYQSQTVIVTATTNVSISVP